MEKTRPVRLSKRQQQILLHIRNSLVHKGKAPTLREIGIHLGISSVGSVGNHLRTLVQKGLIRKSKWEARGLTLVDPHTDLTVDTGAAAGVPLIRGVVVGTTLLSHENIERYICLDHFMTGGQESFLLRVKGDSMTSAGLCDGDYAIVRRQATAVHGDVVVAVLDGQALIKYYHPKKAEVHLVPANDQMYSIIVRDKNFKIEGKVMGVYRELSRREEPALSLGRPDRRN